MKLATTLLMAAIVVAVAFAGPGGPSASEPVAPADDGAEGSPLVLLGEVNGVISAVTAEYIGNLLERARLGHAQLVILEMNTPGGTVAASEEIVSQILRSEPPVAVFVTPSGAQAASAGLYIANAADVIAMSPGTRIGAGHPVGPFGENPGETKAKGRNFLGEKIENDMAAGVRSIATNRGRNAAVYERMVRESIALTEREALDQRVIDLIAADRNDLIVRIDGRPIARFTGMKVSVSLARARVERFDPTTRQRILARLADPNLAILLLVIGVMGLYVEFNHPGVIVPGIVGGAALVLFAISLQILPFNLLGLLLVALGIALFVLEIKFTSYGLLTLGGAICLTLGFMTLFDPERMPSIGVSLAFVLPTVITLALLMGLVTILVVRAQRETVVTGIESLPGEVGEALTEISPAPGGGGKVFVHGEYWDAASNEAIPRGSKVRILLVRDMVVEVENLDSPTEARVK